MATQSVIKGAVVIQGNPEGACFTTFPEFLKSLEQYLGIIIPNQTFSNVVISNVQPGQADRDKIWWRLSNSGTFVGIYGYANNVWSQIFPAPQQVFWLNGDSASPPAGFKFVELGDTNLTAPEYTDLLSNAIPAGGPPYKYYPAIYVGL